MEKLYDLSAIEMMDDNEYVADILKTFLETTPVEMNELRKACVSGDHDRINKAAHKLKSSAGLLEASNLMQVLTRIEQQAKARENEEFSLMAVQANEEYKKIESPLKEYLKYIQAQLRVNA